MIQTCDKWDARFFLLADMTASWSEDTSRKVGCIIVGPANEIRATGYNGLPRGVSACEEIRHSRENGNKYLWFEHAERNAIYNLARTGVSAEGCTMYVNSFPCADCARAIVQSGISTLKTFESDSADEVFSKHFVAAKEMFEEANVRLVVYSRSDKLILQTEEAFDEARDPKNRYFR
ncbi:deoxycytidylate deaminase [Ruegeria arenilitoris]|uniref:deoxycytidylate deaminase n=1 Tax=Ruegeria arenilitoris TaxID=1173585 RepID=UPI003463CACF